MDLREKLSRKREKGDGGKKMQTNSVTQGSASRRPVKDRLGPKVDPVEEHDSEYEEWSEESWGYIYGTEQTYEENFRVQGEISDSDGGESLNANSLTQDDSALRYSVKDKLGLVPEERVDDSEYEEFSEERVADSEYGECSEESPRWCNTTQPMSVDNLKLCHNDGDQSWNKVDYSDTCSDKEEGELSDSDEDMMDNPIHETQNKRPTFCKVSNPTGEIKRLAGEKRRSDMPETPAPKRPNLIPRDINSSQIQRKKDKNDLFKTRTNDSENLPLSALRNQSSNDVASYFAKHTFELFDCLKQRRELDDIEEVVHLLSQVCESTITHKDRVLQLVRTTGFLKRNEINSKCSTIRLEGRYGPRQYDFIINLLRIMEAISSFPDSTVDDVITLLSLTETLNNNCTTDDNMKRCLDNKIHSVYTLLEAKSKDQKKRAESETKKQLHALSEVAILPSIQSIIQRETPAITRHEITRPYKNDAEYLSRQFYLFREDFVRPLRRGITDYISFKEESSRRFRSDDVRLYEEVTVIRPWCDINQGVIWEIQFNVEKFGRVNWEHCGFLQHGNLLCLSYDGFKSIAYATVAGRDNNSLKNGIIRVKRVDNFTNFESFPIDQVFTMLESKAFYTAYAHTLEAIQNIARGLSSRDQLLPFSSNFVSLDCVIAEPEYMKTADGAPRNFSFSSMIKYGNRHATEAERIFPVLDLTEWPSHLQLGLDVSQHAALQLALTKRLVLLQGPPGTGKTLMGLRIAEWFLTAKPHEGPILLVSYTNHALDQFLMGVLQMPVMQNPFLKNIVRVGSRCEEEELEKYNLRQHLRLLGSMSISGRYRRELSERSRSIAFSLGAVQEKNQGLIHEDFLRRNLHMSDSHYESLLSRRHRVRKCGLPENGTMLVAWFQFLEMSKSSLDDFCAKSQNDAYEFEDDVLENENGRVLDEDLEEEYGIKIGDVRNVEEPEMAVSADDLFPGEMNSFWTHISEKRREHILRAINSLTSQRDRMWEEEAESIDDVWELDLSDRWRLYRFWLSRYTNNLMGAMESKLCEFQRHYKVYNEIRAEEENKIFQRAKIVAMTTTGAARYVDTLGKLAPEVVIVEEAAQVPEQHVLTSLTNACKHLILIGDHKQLKPTFNDYQLAKEHKSDTSLMERLVQSGFEYKQLQFQHRMRPEIADLLRPSIYKVLDDDQSVKSYENVKGIGSNVFFITHNHFENENPRSKSHSNDHEAKFIAQLYRYLRLQGYASSAITILSEYRDQVIKIRKCVRELESSNEMKALHESETMAAGTNPDKHFKTRSVRITQVDNFQGEENDIILLSLVRNNKKRTIGHVATENRICVSLSRAKIGMYVIGNFELMRSKSRLWENITRHAQERGFLGEALKLCCSRHPDHVTFVSSEADFSRVPEGGCGKPCEFQLEDCGHVCQRKCHSDDPSHERPCSKPCDRTCEKGHPCKKLCGEKCGPCLKKVRKERTVCKHSVSVFCFENPNFVDCEKRCENILKCGHQCQKKCSQPCNENSCNELVEAKLACSFQKKAVCKNPCDVILECGHPCKGTCNSCSHGRLHQPCRANCSRILVCGHSCNRYCGSDCPPCVRRCEASCFHRGGTGCRKLCGEPCIPCREECNWRCWDECPHQRSCSRLCFELCDRKRCDRPCRRPNKKCGHPCVGLCGEPCPKLCLVCNKEELTEIFFGTEDEESARFIELADCGHTFEVTGLDTYMDGDQDPGDFVAVEMKRCPRCREPIRRSRRYGNVVKKALQDVERIKLKQLQTPSGGNMMDIADPLERAKEYKSRTEGIRRENLLQLRGLKAASDSCFGLWTESSLRTIYEKIREKISKSGNPYSLSTMNQSIKLLEYLSDNLPKSEQTERSLAHECNFSEWLRQHGSDKSMGGLVNTYYAILKWIVIPRCSYSQQELSQFKSEVDRFYLVAKLMYLRGKMDGMTSDSISDEEKTTITHHIKHLQLPKTFSKEELAEGTNVLEVFREKVPANGLGISSDEKMMIIKAMGFSQKGHWYKCKLGHIYAIGECGGAMEQGQCPECSETIGGERHKLRDDNAVASEMDGATHSAWSEHGNLENYNIDDLL